MKQTKQIFTANALVVCGLWLAIVALLNLVGVNVFVRKDLSASQSFALSEVTQKYLGKLTSGVHVRFYLSERALPRTAKFAALRQDVLDLLNEYRQLAPADRFTFDIVDPIDGRREVTAEDKKELENKEGLVAHLENVAIGGGEGNTKTETYSYISTLKLAYKEKYEIINGIKGASGLEYEITRTLAKLTYDEKPRVGFVAGDSDHSLSTMSKFKDALEKVVDVEEVTLGGEPSADKEPRTLYEVPLPTPRADDKGAGSAGASRKPYDALIVMHPKSLDPKAVFALDQYIMGGGRVAFFMKSHWIDRQMSEMRQSPPVLSPITTNLEDVFNHYGLRLVDKLVFDMHACYQHEEQKPVRVGGQWVLKTFTRYYPFAFFTDRAFHDPDNPLASSLDGLFLLAPNGFERTDAGRINPDVTYRALVRSSDKSWAAQLEPPIEWTKSLDAESDLFVQRVRDAQLTKTNAHDLVVQLEGKLTSYYGDNKALPNWTEVVSKWRELKREKIKRERDEAAKKHAAASGSGSGSGSGSSGSDNGTHGSGHSHDTDKDGAADGSDAQGSGSPAAGSGSGSAAAGSGSEVAGSGSEVAGSGSAAAGSGSGSAPAGSGSEAAGSGSGSGRAPVPPEPEIVIPEPQAPQRVLANAGSSRLLFVGESEFMSNWLMNFSFAPHENQNYKFAQSMIEWLAADESLSRLQSKSDRARPLDQELVEKWKALLIACMVGLAPLLVLVAGFVVWQLRKNELEDFERQVRAGHAKA